MPAKNALSSKVTLQIEKRNKGFHRKTKADRVYHHQPYLAKLGERSSSSCNEKTLISDVKTQKSTQHIGKGQKCTVRLRKL